MNKEMKRMLSSYYNDISKALVCGGREKRMIVTNIRNSIDCYLNEHPDSGIDDIYENFGTADAVADEYYNNESADAIRNKIKRSRIIILGIAIVLILALLIYIAAIITVVIADIKSTNGHSITNIETISQTDTIE